MGILQIYHEIFGDELSNIGISHGGFTDNYHELLTITGRVHSHWGSPHSWLVSRKKSHHLEMDDDDWGYAPFMEIPNKCFLRDSHGFFFG